MLTCPKQQYAKKGGCYLRPNNTHRHYVEDIALHFEQAGLSRTAGRIFGWLLICQPPHQTMTELVDGLQISKSSISTATRYLMQVGLIQRFSLPGIRQDYYRIAEGVWQNSMNQQQEQVTILRKLAEQGINLLVDQPAERLNRLQEMRDFYTFLEREFPLLLDRWQAERDGSK